uniref:NADH-ubiquinone oxidoreductase chain 2 n=1 Tax=Stygobromus indentatus TaxID=1678292 RepID=A0A172QHD0_9CRUS|nr:NADH dehydrogenase subunit 2 [Stygobromus indentatus]AND97092.1 NADH dehydrogenase subunit 2 [Stygobromus indentatus]
MIFHPSIFMFIISLCVSIIMIIGSNSWFMAWLGLEINLLSFIPLMLNKNKYSSESALKYFLIQALASTVILASAILGLIWLPIFSPMLLLLALLLKVGAAPFHQWLPATVEGLSWSPVFILLTAQKLAPLMLISYMFMEHHLNMILNLFIIISALTGSLGGLSLPSLRKILSFSSIAHMGWILASIKFSNFLWLIYFMMYSLILYSVIHTFYSGQLNKLSHLTSTQSITQSLMSTLPLLSLGGLPPFSGFLPKFLVMSKLISFSDTFIFMVLLISTLISLFFYMRVAISTFFISRSILSNKKKIDLNLSSLILNLIGLLAPSILFILM